MSKKVVCAGHICVDITPAFPPNKKGKIEDMLIPGKLVQVGAASVSTGGSVANTGLAMKILGADVKLAGIVGTDAFGDIVMNTLAKYDACEGMIQSDQATSSYTMVVAVPGVDRIFLHHPGANDEFTSEDIDFEHMQDVGLLHFGYPTIMRKMFLNGGEEMIRMYKKAKELNIATSLDLSAVDADTEAGQADWKQILTDVMPYVDFFVPSIEELGFMLDRDRYNEWIERAAGRDITTVLSIEKDVKPLGDMLMDMGAKVVLIKCGVPGMYYRSADEEVLKKVGSNLEWNRSTWCNKEGFQESYVPEKVLSGTGCGDTSIGAFLTSMINGYSMEDCVRLSAATGASCVATYDSLSGLKSLDELMEKINKGWETQHFSGVVD